MFWKISYFTNKYNLIIVKQALQEQFLTPLLFESNYGKFKSKGFWLCSKISLSEIWGYDEGYILEEEWSGGWDINLGLERIGLRSHHCHRVLHNLELVT